MSYGPLNYGFGGEGPRGPAVVPRAQYDDGTSSLPVERLILPMLRAGERGLVVITAPPGGGKTTALEYLQVVLPGYGGVAFFDERPAEAVAAAKAGLAVLASVAFDPGIEALAHFALTPWALDDCIEYLAARHREQLKRVVKLLAKDDWLASLKGSPQLLAMVMDAMAGDETIRNALEAMRAHIDGLQVPGDVLGALLVECCNSLGIPFPTEAPFEASAFVPYRYFLRHAAARRVWVAQSVAIQLSLGEIPKCLKGMAAAPLLGEIAAAVGARPMAVQMLEKLIAADQMHKAVAMAASILLRIQPEWRPGEAGEYNFHGADLRSAKWAGIDLRHAVLGDADLSNANLDGATIRYARGANFSGASLQKARLYRAVLDDACLAGADLTEASAGKSFLCGADCENANFTSADLAGAEMKKTILKGAKLLGADLSGCQLVRTRVEGASFDHVDFTRAAFRGVRLNRASWNSPCFRRATLRRCNLEGLVLPGADFTKADCTGSLFTSSRIPRGIFVGANLQKTGLAEVEWDNADLRDVDFTNASFHLGSSRSGLVGSTIPGEGSRTGFYTDEFTEQDFKSPEEIRKACLCGADLSGAAVEQTDFYLVDLRGAKYSKSQARHFRGCGAILVTKVP